jgi:hypothetical protein
MALAYRVIEISLDAQNNETNRLPSCSFDSKEAAANSIENVLSRYKERGFDADGLYWWGTAINGDRSRFIIEVT